MAVPEMSCKLRGSKPMSWAVDKRAIHNNRGQPGKCPAARRSNAHTNPHERHADPTERRDASDSPFTTVSYSRDALRRRAFCAGPPLRARSSSPSSRVSGSHRSEHNPPSPSVSILRETGTLYPYDAEALAGRRFHQPPSARGGSPPWRLALSSAPLRQRYRQSRCLCGPGSWSTRWISTMGSSGGVCSMR